MQRFVMVALVGVALLSACGKSPEQAKADLAKKNIPLTEASLIDQTKSVASQENAQDLVTAGVDVNAKQENGMTALMSAALHSQKETVAALLKRGADLEIEARGFTALICAVSGGNKDIVEALLAKGADVNHRTAEGNSPLKAARGAKNTEIEQLLLKAGAKD